MLAAVVFFPVHIKEQEGLRDGIVLYLDLLREVPFDLPVGVEKVVELEIPRKHYPPCIAELQQANFTWAGKNVQLISIRDITRFKLTANALTLKKMQIRMEWGKIWKHLDLAEGLQVALNKNGH